MRHKANDEEQKLLAFQISERIAVALVQDLELTAGHPYYGGMGLIYNEATYVFGAINDGYITSPSEYQKRGDIEQGRCEFANREVFVDWLASALLQADSSSQTPLA